MSKYRNRERDWRYMGAVKQLPCLLANVDGAGPCLGVVEADHAGPRTLGRKADDNTCIPLCTGHHMHRHGHHGYFADFDRWQMRAWCNDAIARTRPLVESYLGIAAVSL